MFSGTCGEAFRRYASLFGGEIVNMLTYAESPLEREVPPEWRDKVWFARLRAGGLDVTGGDALPRDYETPRGFSLVLGVANADEADRVFAGLAEGGEVIMPLQATHWSPRYGLVRDPFGNDGKSTATQNRLRKEPGCASFVAVSASPLQSPRLVHIDVHHRLLGRFPQRRIRRRRHTAFGRRLVRGRHLEDAVLRARFRSEYQ